MAKKEITSTRIEDNALAMLKTIGERTGRSMTKALTHMITKEFEDVTGITFAKQKVYLDYVTRNGHPPDNDGYMWDADKGVFIPRP